MALKLRDEIVKKTKSVCKGLETIRIEQNTLLAGMAEPHKDNEKLEITRKNIERIQLGLKEGELMVNLAAQLQIIEVERKKIKTQVRRLYDENKWLREELTDVQKQFHTSEQRVAQLEVEKKHLEFMLSLKEYDESKEQEDGWKTSLAQDPVAELFPDEQVEPTLPNQSFANPNPGYELSPRLHTIHNLVIQYATEGRYEVAVPLCKQALEDLEKTTNCDHPDFAAMLNILALLYQDLKRYDEATKLLHKAMRIRRKALGDIHPAVVATLNNLALLHMKRKMYKEAEVYCLQALDIRENVLGRNHKQVAKQLNNLASLQLAQKRYVDTEQSYKRALKIFESELGPHDLYVDKTKTYLANLYAMQGRYPEAEILYKQVAHSRLQQNREDTDSTD